MPVLTINAGSSSIRFALYGDGEPAAKLIDGKIERVGQKDVTLAVKEPGTPEVRKIPLNAADHRSAGIALLDWLDTQPLFRSINAVGHRIVHGMSRTSPARVSAPLLEELKAITPYDPEHMPREIELIEAVAARRNSMPQVACFDTSFHRTMPRVATILPIPRRWQSKGVLRYGFHGLSYTYLMQELARRGDPAAARGRVVLAHLGSGASLAAVLHGRCIDTTMGFTPTGGIAMSTRSGDLDPGVLAYLAVAEKLDASALQRMVNHNSGLLGLSETSGDIRDLLECEAQDVRAREAVELFCYQAKKAIAAFAGVLGGLDTLVFSGGIGENSAVIRRRICTGLEYLGVELRDDANMQSSSVISSDASSVSVRVIRTDEESVIAALTIACLRGDSTT